MHGKPRRYGILRYSQGPAGTHLDGFESRWGYQENRATARFSSFDRSLPSGLKNVSTETQEAMF